VLRQLVMKLVPLLFFAALQPLAVISEKILLLGDSIDRITVHEWCSFKERQGFRVNLTISWCNEYELNRGAHKWHCCSCQTDNDTIGAVHLFGSAETGPYHHSVEKDEYEATKIRLTVMIPKYISLYGHPDRVMFHTSQWDARCGETKANEHKPLEKFRLDTNARLDEIRAIVGNETDVGVRTAAWSVRGGIGIREYNVAIQDIAHQKNLTFYDFDHDVWSSVNHNYAKEWHLFRDEIHPISPFPERSGEKLLGHRFTKYLKVANPDRAIEYENRFQSASSMAEPPALRLDTFKNVTYFYNNIHRTWHQSPDENFLYALRLGPSETLEFDSRTDNKVANLGVPPPSFFHDGTVFNRTDRNKLVHYRSSILMFLYGDGALNGLCKNVSDVVQVSGYDASWLDLLASPKETISTAYDNKEEWILKRWDAKPIYLIRNCTRIRMSGPEALVLLKKTMDDVVFQNPTDNLEIFPIYKHTIA
jgi:hypothetical protein